MKVLILFLCSATLGFGSYCRWTADVFGNNYFEKVGEPGETVQIKIEPKFFSKNKTAKLSVDGKYKAKAIEITEQDFEDIKKNCDYTHLKWPQDVEDKLRKENKAGVAGPRLSISMAAFGGALDDLNGDGIADSVDTNFSPAGVNVTLSRSNGSFANPVRYTTGPGPEALLLADFNGDTFQDIAVAFQGELPSNTGGVAILLGVANGTFSNAVNYTAGIRPVSLTAGDFNGDGKLDLAVANAGSAGFPGVPNSQGGVSVLRGSGDGTFQTPVQLTAGNSPSSIVAAHMNADQNLDLVVANLLSGNLSVFYGTGGGAFQAAVNTDVGERPSYLGIAEFNGDLIADVAVLHRDSATLSMWMGTANQTFNTTGRYLMGSGVQSFAILPVEDYARPMIVSPDAARVRLLMMFVDLDGTVLGSRTYVAGAGGNSVAAADFNKDGKADVVTAGNTGLMLWRSRPQLNFGDATEIALQGAGAMAAGDFTGDGNADLAVANSSGLSMLAGRGDGTFQPPASVAGGSPPSFLASADVNGDGSRDLISLQQGAQNQGTVSVFRGNGSGSFQAPQTYPAGFAVRSVAAGDFNGDGRQDLVTAYFGDLASNRGGSRVLLQNADGTFQAGTTIDSGLAMSTVAVGDFNRDGRMDFAAAGQLTGEPSFKFGVSILLGNGNGAFAPRTEIDIGYGPSQLAAGDFDGDGVTDLVVARCCGDTDFVLLAGNGDGTFRQRPFAAGSDPVTFAVGDFDGDQRPDLAVIASRVGFSTRSTMIVLENRLRPIQVLSAAASAPGFVAPDSIVSVYGTLLATSTTAAPSAAWPASLAGTTVKVQDESGVRKDAEIAFTSPGQLNIHMPAGLSSGTATVTVNSVAGGSRSAPLDLRSAEPGLFVVNADQVAAAYVLRVRADSSQVLEPVVTLNTSQQVVASPIDFGPSADRLFLLLYGTGFRNGVSTTVTVGDRGLNVLYAGPQNEYPGLDQANVELPRSLVGSGLVDVVLTTKGIESNVVKLRFK